MADKRDDKVCRILKELFFHFQSISNSLIASQNFGTAIPQKLSVVLCLNALKVKTGPENRIQAVFAANLVGCGF